MTRRSIIWLSIGSIVICGSLLVRIDNAEAMFGEDIPFLIQIVTQSIQEVSSLTQIIGKSRETVSLLEDMNRGVKDVLHLAETAHVPLPPQVYEQAKQIDQATQTAESIYGPLSEHSPRFTQTQYRSGVEGLFLSQDAFDYSNFMDGQGRKIKDSAVVADQSSATRLTAESMGVLLQTVDQTNRLQAKSLEMSSTGRIEESSKENARFESFVDTQTRIEQDMENTEFASLPAFDETGGQP
jgi:hypothetical protein